MESCSFISSDGIQFPEGLLCGYSNHNHRWHWEILWAGTLLSPLHTHVLTYWILTAHV